MCTAKNGGITLGIRDHMQFNCTVKAAHYDEESSCWDVELAGGRRLRSRYLFTAIGLLSAPTKPRYDGVDTFEGTSFHSYDWPEHGLNLEGKKVAVIGTGATGVQIISEIAGKVGELKVFQRRPNWCAPLKNSPIADDEQAALKAPYGELLEQCRSTPGGFIHGPIMVASSSIPEQERNDFWEELYDSPGFGIWLGNYVDILLDEDANATFSEFIANKIRQRVDDPVVAEKLIPKDHGFGTRRVPLETRYFEAYNVATTSLVDLNETPIERITPRGIKTSTEEHEFDVIIYATGFDAIIGAFEHIDFRGRNGVSLKDKWQDDPQTYLGLQIRDFPNMFTLAGPQSASVGSNFPPAIQAVVEWTCDLLAYMESNRFTVCEPTAQAQLDWLEQVKEGYDRTLLGNSKSWFTGFNSNVDGHDKMRHLVLLTPAPKFREQLKEIASEDYRGMEMS